MGDVDEPLRVNEHAINYIKFVKSFDRKATIDNTYFSKKIVDILDDLEPQSMEKGKRHSDCGKCKETIKAEITSLYKRASILRSNGHFLRHFSCWIQMSLCP